MGSFLGNKVLQKFKFLKLFINKKCAPKIIFFNEKKIRRSRIILDIHSKLTLKVRKLQFDPRIVASISLHQDVRYLSNFHEHQEKLLEV